MQICLKECCLKTNLSKGPRNKTEEKTRKERSKGQRRNVKEITELISADISQPIITDVNVEGVVSLTRDQIRYLKEMAKKWENF